MSCYHPMLAAYDGTFDGKPRYKIIGTAYNGIKHHPMDKAVPCGQCIGCRLDKSRVWADRMVLELDHSKAAIFVTLTYDNDHVPIGSIDDNGVPVLTLVKRDVQLYLKRLRKHFADREIRFYLAGEYGDQTLRPHYHAILFGLSLHDFVDLQLLGINDFKQPLYNSDLMRSIWQCGNISIGNVSWQTCAYVARYVQKKLTGKGADYYTQLGIEPPFALMSRRPGIAGYFAVEHADKLGDTYQYVTDDNGITPRTKISTPAYLVSKLQDINPDLYEDVKIRRQRYANDKLLMELQQTDLSYVEYLNVKERELARRISSLTRDKL